MFCSCQAKLALDWPRIILQARCIITKSRVEVDIVRELPLKSFRWPSASEAADDAALAGNHHYADLRGLTRQDYQIVRGVEQVLLGRIQNGVPEEKLLEELEDEADHGEEHPLHWLDIGIASPVVALSAIGCVPAYSCNGGVLGGHHRGEHPIIAFFAKPKLRTLLLDAAAIASIGLRPWTDGVILAYAAELEPLQRFGEALMERASD